jgi:uncharacterized protein (DUF927 family)
LVAAAGELATTVGIFPWPPGEASRAASVCFRAWLDARGGTGAAELREGQRQIRAFLEAHGNSRFEEAWPNDLQEPSSASLSQNALSGRTITRAGFRRKEASLSGTEGKGERWDFYVLPETWRREVCKGFDASTLARDMIRRGWMRRGDGKHLARKIVVPGMGTVRLFHITADFLAADEAA